MIGQSLPVNLSVNPGVIPVNAVMPHAVQAPDSTSQIIGDANQITAEMNLFATDLQKENVKNEQQKLQKLQQQYLTALQAPRSASPPPSMPSTVNPEVAMTNATTNQLYAEGNRLLATISSAPTTMPTLPTSPTGVSSPSTSGTPTALNSTTLSGDKGSQLAQAATALKGASSKDGPGGGNVACAWKTAKALRQLGYDIKPGSPEEINVNAQIAFLKKKGAQEVDQSEARPGDVVWVPGRHIGIVESGQGTAAQVISNSSSKASFSWQSDINFDKHYGQNTKILRLA